VLCCAPVAAGADLGIIFDTDVDRSAVVDSDGTPINSNRFIALMAAIVLQVGSSAQQSTALVAVVVVASLPQRPVHIAG
jgi:phosphomannomutase